MLDIEYKTLINNSKSIFNNSSSGSIFYGKENETNTVVENFKRVTNLNLDSVRIIGDSLYGADGGIKGNDIYVASNAVNKEEILAHELVHYLQNVLGEVDNECEFDGESFNFNSNLEKQADLASKELTVSPKNLNIEKTRNILNIGKDGVGNVNKQVDCPTQFWGVGGIGAQIMACFKGNSFGVLGGEHEAILRTSIEAVNQENKNAYSQDDLKNLKRGCNFNDNCSLNHISFLIKYFFKNDEYINESQEGSLVMLHCMGPDGELLENKQKAIEWFKFCLDAYYNENIDGGRKFQDITLLEYIQINKENPMLLEMFLPILLKKEAIDDLKFCLTLGNDDYYDAGSEREKRSILITEILNILKEIKFDLSDNRLSKYAKMTVREFFCSGDPRSNLTSRGISMIAVGSLLHLVHDSMANAHSQRAYDPRLEECLNDEIDFKDYKKVIEAISPIVNIQDPTRQVNHNYGDYFSLGKNNLLDVKERINNTNGARQAQLTTKSILNMLSEGANKGTVLLFLDKIMKLDENSEIIEYIKMVKKSNFKLDDEIKNINDLKVGTELEGLDFLNKNISLTAGGRGYDDYEIGCDEPFGGQAYEKGLEYMKNVRSNEVHNDIKGLDLRLELYKKQLDMLKFIVTYSINKKTKDAVRKHVTEILINVLNILKFRDFEKIKNIKEECIDIINNFT